MSRIRFLCPECDAKLSVESDNAHQFTNCPKCRKSIRAWGARLLDIKFGCSKCGKKMVIDAKAAGCTIECPECKTANKVPTDVATPRVQEQNTAVNSRNVVRGAAPLLTSEEVTFLVGSPD